MSNIGTTSRYNGVKPPISRNNNKQSSYVRSPSSSRLVNNNQPSNNNSPTKILVNQPFSLSRKTGSCQNLAAINNQVTTDLDKRMSQLHSTSYDKYNSQSRIPYGTTVNKSSTTNNSFGSRDYAASNAKFNFYNGYNEMSSTKPIGNSHLNNKSTSLSSTTSDISDKTLANQFNRSSSSSYDGATNTKTVGYSYLTSSQSNNTDNGNKYKAQENGSVNHQRVNGSSSSMKSDTTKSLNNSSNDRRGLVGLANLGNTCFMNSVLQCLSNCKPLHEYCLSNVYETDLNSNSKTRGALMKSYCEMMKSMWRSDSETYISPDKFRRNFQKIAPSFNSSAQQDSQEFLRIMLEGLHQDVNKVQQRPKPIKVDEDEDAKLPDKELANVYWSRYIRIDNSFIVDLFVGQLKSTLLCRKCGFKSVTFDPFWDLSLPLPKNHRGNTTLTECLDLFTSEEELEGDEMPKCARCKQKRPCSKSFSIQKFPPVLVIHLKRFSGDRYRSKISTFIEFPSSTLNLSPYAADTSAKRDVTYRLFGISNHSGTVYGGHYTAYCCHPVSNLWYEFNDTRVHRVDDSRVCSSEAYVLFYEIVR